ncbi:hypothetical protein KUL42_38720 [Alteromonas sp. KUL42]|uniref:hypothetical protein n=1 Tax=Alteromonas sp. KUL42 TaxID=2480797 RepID=UPI001036C518|nr:hypothetical protein [Alteromonas sp. KUL42]GEA09111.1 hypothetical protein KUL42_38720 [Alteromonas sp. KUL42]
MVITNRKLAVAVSEYVKDIDAYMLGFHEVEFRRLTNSLRIRADITAMSITRAISNSPLWRYRFQYEDEGEIKLWSPFIDSCSFNDFRRNKVIRVDYLGDDVSESLKHEMMTSCMHWCRRFSVRGVPVSPKGREYAVG